MRACAIFSTPQGKIMRISTIYRTCMVSLYQKIPI